jgi:rfaE bifunctional protein kinase chain/domain
MMKELLDYLPRMRGKRIGVFGDLIADEYVYGTIHRFSREAPVFIVNYEDSQIGLGGAANAIHNIHDLGGVPIPFGVVGSDLPGRTLVAILRDKGIDINGVLVEETRATFVKQRIVAGSPHSVRQQILRLDRCQAIPAEAACHALLRERILHAVSRIDSLIVSDYSLGTAQAQHAGPILEECGKRGVPVFVDSRQHLASFRGITAATPNEPEVEAIIGKTVEGKTLLAAGKELLGRLQARALLITRGKNGMALFTSNAEPQLIPIFGSTDIVDVTGAGDTVISTFALGVSAGASYVDAARLANCAAGIVVMKRGAATVSPEELTEAIRIAEM